MRTEEVYLSKRVTEKLDTWNLHARPEGAAVRLKGSFSNNLWTFTLDTPVCMLKADLKQLSEFLLRAMNEFPDKPL